MERLGRLEPIIRQLIHKGLATSSRRSYDAKWKHWELFRAIFGVDNVVATEDLLLAYVGFRALFSEASGQTISGEISAILSLQLEEFGALVPDRGRMRLLRRALNGMKATRVSRRPVKKPITENLLRRFLHHIPGDSLDGQCLRAALAVGYSSLMRGGEFVVESQTQVREGRETVRLLRWHQVFLVDGQRGIDAVRIELDGSKTNQYGKEEEVALACKCLKGGLCAVHELLGMLEFRRVQSLDEPVFLMASGDILTRRVLDQTIKDCATREGLNPKHYAPHGLRKGGATDLAGKGVSELVLQRLGRWSPNATTSRLYTLLQPVNLARKYS